MPDYLVRPVAAARLLGCFSSLNAPRSGTDPLLPFTLARLPADSYRSPAREACALDPLGIGPPELTRVTSARLSDATRAMRTSSSETRPARSAGIC